MQWRLLCEVDCPDNSDEDDCEEDFECDDGSDAIYGEDAV